MSAATPRDATLTTGRLRLGGVPFADDRVTAGSETELQVTVQGRADAVDLPLMIAASRFYANLLKRSTAKDTPKKALRELQRILRDERGGVWENSWVRFSRERLSPAAQRQLISDNVSPETCSFYVSALAGGSEGGRRLARETAERFLLTHLLVAYANQTFGLLASGQRAIVHFSPQTPLRQRQLNECISDAFYRELFTSPCLSGWDRGEDKHAYMRLCHEVLSRRLAEIAEERGAAEEKRLGDLVTKIVEHFLPLFIGTYSAAPCRIDFADFHAERVLRLLPHELDYTHLPMLWRRWKRKAGVTLFGQPLTPTGLPRVDQSHATCGEGVYMWAFRHRPSDGWQVLAAVPRSRDARGEWRGMNLSWR